MFYFLIILALLIFAFLCLLSGSIPDTFRYPAIAAGATIVTVLVVVAVNLPQGKMFINKLSASSKTGHWLVVDNSGGETMRHWILSGYVESQKNSDGWQFTDTAGNLNYVGGGTFILLIKQDIEEFKKTYREKYNIPADQIALE
jgi:hypothetical protein